MTTTPQVGCGIALWRDECLLLLQRRAAPEEGSWSFPGGKVDAFEPTERAAARETGEELAIEVGPLELLCVVDLIDRAAVYLATTFTGEPRIVEPHKHDGLAWFALDALPDPVSEAVRVAADALRRKGAA